MSASTFNSTMKSANSTNSSNGTLFNDTEADISIASKSALEFLANLDESSFDHQLFSDTLITTSDMGKEVGEFVVTFEITTHHQTMEDCILVHANSHGAIDNVPCGTSITSHISFKLETIEQQHHEYVKLENHPLDRKTFIIRQDDGYVVNRIITQGQDVRRSAQTFDFDSMEGFISEGGNLLLQRLLIKKGFTDDFQLVAFDSEAKLSPVYYRNLEKRLQVIEETEVEVQGIERTIRSRTDMPTSWQSYFTQNGYLTSRVQVGSPVTMRVINLPPVIEQEEIVEKPTFPKKDIIITEDMEMMSKFLDRKEELKASHATYMKKHPELKALMADFTQFLLLRKPDDVIAFAADYFASFSTGLPSSTPYLESAATSPYPENKLNSKIQYLSENIVTTNHVN